jgi:hypothetical protein
VTEQQAWAVQVTVLATRDQLDAIVDRMGEAICTRPDHPGPCDTPWDITYTAVDDLDVTNREAWLPSVATLVERRHHG